MNKKIIVGLGLAAGGITLAAATAYTEILTSVIARRQSPLTDHIIAAATNTGTVAPTDTSIREKAGLHSLARRLRSASTLVSNRKRETDSDSGAWLARKLEHRFFGKRALPS